MRFSPRLTRPLLLFTLAGPLTFPTVGILTADARAGREVTARLTAPTGSVTVPLNIRSGTLYVDATLNGKPARFIVDTGASVTVLTPDAAKKFQVRLDDTRGTITGAATVAARRGVVDRLSIGAGNNEAILEKETAVVVSLPEELHCDGLIGGTFLSRWAVTVDYANSRLTLTDAKRFRGPSGAVSLPLLYNRDIPAIEAQVNDVPGIFRIDTGANDSLTLFGPWVEKNRLREKLPRRIKTITGQGVGGFLYGELVRLPSFTLGGITIKDVIGELSSNDKTSAFHDEKTAGNIGASIWRRFTVTLDYPGKRLYLVKNGDFSLSSLPNRCGLSASFRDGLMQIIDVIADSPASEAGLKVGDTILAMNGIGLTRMEPDAARALLRAEPGTTVTLLVRAPDAASRTVKITLRDLL